MVTPSDSHREPLDDHRIPPSEPDSHPELARDPDTGSARPLHLRPTALAWVFAGGLVGTGARYLIEKAYPFHAPGWPWATFGVNLLGAFALGVVLEALARMGDDTGWRQRVRLLFGTGVCGSVTTYSAFALEASLIGREGDVGVAVAYSIVSVVAGLIMAWAGITLAAAIHSRRAVLS
jgi:CrcB protein